MQQILRFGLVLGQFAVLKKNVGPIMSNFWGCFFMFSEAIFFRNKTFLFVVQMSWKKRYLTNKWRAEYLRDRTTMFFSIANRPKTSPNLNLFSIKMLTAQLIYNDFGWNYQSIYILLEISNPVNSFWIYLWMVKKESILNSFYLYCILWIFDGSFKK